MSFSHKTRVGVLRGGPSPEYEVSLKTGAAILANMPEEYEPMDILISKEGVWHDKGMEKSPEKILSRVDAIINGLHGKYGEDGEVQNLMDRFGVPYTGSGALASALCMNKISSKKIFKNNDIKTPHFITISSDNLSKKKISDIYHGITSPFVVKPSSAGSSVGIRIVSSLSDLEDAVLEAAQYSPNVLIEEFIKGKEATCGVVDNFRGHEIYPLLPIEIRVDKGFFDYNSKYSAGGAKEICPGNFTEKESKEIERMAVAAHRVLDLRHYSRSDFIINPRRGIFILETNSLPGLTETSLIPKSLAAIGSNIKEFLSHLLRQVLKK
jgi:D-alanine-D-alanine ligase